MKLKLCTALLAAATVLSPTLVAAETPQNAVEARRAAVEGIGKLPLSFESTASPSVYLARSGRYSVQIGAHEAAVTVGRPSIKEPSRSLRFAFDKANPKTTLEAQDLLPGETNYYYGKDPANWRLGVKSYARLNSTGIYPGVDVVYYGDHRQLEFDFVVAPKADASVIALQFSGMDKIYQDSDGSLVAQLAGQPVRFAKPYAYQTAGAKVEMVEASYEVASSGRVQLHLGNYDHSRQLIIDPVVNYATYLGGSSVDVGNGIAVDSAGSAYITGETCSTKDFPDAGDANGYIFEGACDTFVTKYSVDGQSYVYTTVLGGNTPAGATAIGYGIALDASNQAYIVGTANVDNLPGTPASPSLGAYQGGDTDAFIVILSPTGKLVRSSYLGGSDADAGYGIAVDQASPANVAVVGQTCSFDFPGYNAFETMVEACVAFVTELDNNLDIGSHQANGSALSPNKVVAGKTYYFSEFYGGQPVAPFVTTVWQANTYFPYGAILYDNNTPQGVQVAQNGGTSCGTEPAFSTTKLAYTTDCGITWQNVGPTVIPVWAVTEAYGVAIDPPGDIFVAGGTNTAASLAPFNSHTAGGAWVLKVLGKSGKGQPGTFVYGWTLETTLTDVTAKVDTARAIAVDSLGRAYVTGTTTGTMITTGAAYHPAPFGGQDAFLIRMNQLGSAVEYATYLGGTGNDQGLGVAVDNSFQAYVTGATSSTDLPVINPLLNPNTSTEIPLSGTQNAFIQKATADGSALLFSAYLGGSQVDQANAIAVDPGNQGNIYVTGGTTSVDLLTSLLTQPAALPNYTPPQANYAGGGDAFMAMILGKSLPTVTVTPGSLTFPSETQGQTSPPEAVIYSIAGSSPVNITNITIDNPAFTQDIVGHTGGNSADCEVGQLTPPAVTGCTIWITFTPNALNGITGTLKIYDNTSTEPHVVHLSGQGAIPYDVFSATSMAFPTQAVSTTSAAKSITLKNTSANGTLLISSIALAGANPGDYAESDTCGTQLAGGATCTISATFTPTGAGQRNATLIVTDNSLNSPHDIYLSGTGALVPTTLCATSASSPLCATSLSFAQQQLHTPSAAWTVKITNADATGEELLLGAVSISAGSSDYQITSNNCTGATLPDGSSCAVSVVFTPSASGTRNGTLTISGNGTVSGVAMPIGVPMTGTAGASSSLSATTLNFPGTNIGSSSVTQPVTLTNQSAFPFNVNSISFSGAGAAEFSQTNNCGTSVSAAGSCTITVTFSPTAIGNQNATLSVASDAVNSPQSVYIVGVGTAPALTPATGLNFGNQPISAPSAPMTATLTNPGDTPLTVGAASFTGPAAADYSVQFNTCGTQLAVGENCSISVIFTPSALYSRSATLNVADGAANSPQHIALLGSGVQVQVPSIAPASLTFTNQAIGVASAVQTVTITNNDPNYALTLGTPAITPNDFQVNKAGTTCGTTLAKSSTCVVGVTFAPTVSGARTGTLSVATNGSTTPLSVSLSGTGGAQSSVSPSSLNFASANLGEGSTVLVGGGTATVTLSNSSSFPVNLTGITVTGASASQFSFTNFCGSQLAAQTGANPTTCKINVVFTPSALGVQSASLVISSDAATPFPSVALTGTGTQPTASLSASNLAFGSQVVNLASTPQTVTLTNNGTGPLNISGIGISGTQAAAFSGSNSCGSQLAVGSSCTLSVVFTPTSAVVYNASLVVFDDAAGGSQSVLLSGLGVAGSGTIQLSTTTVSYGTVTIGSSATQNITLTNSATTGSLSLTAITLTGNSDFSFAATGNTCGSSLGPSTSCQIIVTFTPTATGYETATVTVTGSASNSPKSVSLSGTGSSGSTGTTEFSVTTPSPGASVTQGTPADFNFSVAPNNKSTATVAFACVDAASGEPWSTAHPGSSCSFSPSSVKMNGSDTSSVSLVIVTGSGTAKLAAPRMGERPFYLALLPFSLFGILLVKRQRRGLWVVLTLLCLCLLMGLASCGSGTGSSSNGIHGLAPNNTYIVNVTATDSSNSSIQQIIPLQLTVTAK